MWLFLLLLPALPAVDMRCSLNGNAQENGQCRCNDGWRGPTCGALDFLPARDLEHQVAGVGSDNSTWGMSVVSINGTFHAYMTEIAGNCSLMQYGRASQIVHMTASSVTGPWTRRGVALAWFAHNPQIVQAPDGTLMLFHIGTEVDKGCLANCSHNHGAPLPQPPHCKDITSPTHASSVATATSPYGPWKRYPYIFGYDKGSCDDDDDCPTNPAPLILSNGTIIVATRRALNGTFPMYIGHVSTPAGPWKRTYALVQGPAVSIFEEDPFMWRGKDRSFHMLTHREVGSKGGLDGMCGGGHLYSLDGRLWYTSGEVAYDCPITFHKEKSKLTSRQRPVLFEHDSKRYLFTGASAGTPQSDHSFTIVQQIDA